MTERKPDDVSWESWIERQIQDGLRAGAFDDLDGMGRPIRDLDTVHDDLWWVKKKLRDEDVNFLPPTIAIRAERAKAIETAMRSATEAEVRAHVEDVNARIRYVNSHATAGPPSTVVTIDPEVIVSRWRAASPAPEPDLPEAPPPPMPPTPARRWRLRRRRRP